MCVSQSIVFLLESIGTIAFAVTGVLVAVESKLDFFGIVFTGCITAVGGGISRDILLGNTPPAIFGKTLIIMIAIIVSVIAFLLLYIKKNLYLYRAKIEDINNFFDAVGLGVFSVMGAEVALTSGFENNFTLVIISGMVTGIGGGMIRDILTNSIPFVLRKYVYAVASLVGTLAFYFIKVYWGNLPVASVVGTLLIILIRLLAIKYRWRLPKIEIDK